MAANLNWDLCRSFLAVLREGNLSRAARVLRLTQPTLGRHIDEIEKSLGVALFIRSPQGLAPTDAAFDLKPHAEAMAAAAEALIRTASGSAGEARGTVRITASELSGAEVLPPILSRFRAKYPGIAIELALTNRTEDLLRREADIGVRMVRPTQAALLAKQVGQVRFAFYAHKSYIALHGAPKTLDELRGHTLIGFDKGMTAIQALRERGPPITREEFAFRSDSAIAQVAMLRAGYGIGACPQAIARRDPDLIPIMHDQFGVTVDLWVAMHEDARKNRRMRLMFDHLVKELGAATAGKSKPATRKGAAA